LRRRQHRAEDTYGAGNRAGQPGGVISGASQLDQPTGTAIIHIVQAGDTLMSIAAQYGTSETDLERLNLLNDPRHLRVGEELQAGQESLLPAAPQGE
jgi:LysM repeat protein